MSVLIKGMEMPEEGEYHMTLYVCSDGSAYIDVASFPVDGDRFEAVPVQEPHGRLGDLDELYDHLNEWYLTHEHGFFGNEKIYIRAMRLGVKDAPTIIPAS